MTRISLGFDPAFLDLIVTLLDDKGDVLQELPDIGHHVRHSIIEKMAGGNGVNLVRTMIRLGYSPTLVCPINSEFTQLLSNSGITKVHKIHSKINTTIALGLTNGEIQINNVSSSLGQIDWTRDIQNLWVNSKHCVFLNWGLNPTSVEWITCQWLALCGIKFEEIVQDNNLNPVDYKTTKVIILDPGSIKEHMMKDGLIELLRHFIKMEHCILICNEEESVEFLSLKPNKFFIHSADKIIIHWDGEIHEIAVPEFTNLPISFIGAGDAFLAGVLDSISQGNSSPVEMVKNGIKVAQKHIINNFK